jgi:hypothetical protein
MYRAHYVIPIGSAVVQRLFLLLADEIKLTAGLSSPWINQCDFLIAAAPPHTALASPLLKALIVPFADVPSPAREALRQAPPLPVYTVHFDSETVAETAVSAIQKSSS